MGCICGQPRVSPTLHLVILNSSRTESSTPLTKVEDLKIKPETFVQCLHVPFPQRYKVLTQLGSGSFGKVYKVQHLASKQLRAVKAIEKRISLKQRSQDLFFSEVEILRKLDHPNILSIYEVLEDDKYYYVVSELCEGGELFTYITARKRLDESLAACVMRQILSAVAYCHDHKVVHRDLKPENLLLDAFSSTPQAEVHIKLIDFGTSCFYEDNQVLKKVLGTPFYIAPEVLKGSYDEKCDVWSCGVIMFILLCGFPPFAGPNDQAIMRKVSSGQFSFAHRNWHNVSSRAKDLITRMLSMDRRVRPSALECLQAPWLQTQSASQPHCDLDLALVQLHSFTKVQHLRLAVLSFLTSQHLQKDCELQLAQTFRAIDKDGDGKLSREELLAAYAGQSLGNAETIVDKVLQEVDSDGSGFIDYTEFLVACADQENILCKANLRAAFDAFDLDHSGKISASELRAMLGAGTDVSPEIWSQLISQADRNGDGEIEYSEFVAMMQAT